MNASHYICCVSGTQDVWSDYIPRPQLIDGSHLWAAETLVVAFCANSPAVRERILWASLLQPVLGCRAL